jgi:hypothetical protein
VEAFEKAQSREPDVRIVLMTISSNVNDSCYGKQKRSCCDRTSTSAAYTHLARTRCEVGKPRRPTDAKLTGCDF